MLQLLFVIVFGTVEVLVAADGLLGAGLGREGDLDRVPRRTRAEGATRRGGLGGGHGRGRLDRRVAPAPRCASAAAVHAEVLVCTHGGARRRCYCARQL